MKKKVISILIIFVGIIVISTLVDKKNFITKTVIYNGNNLRVSIDGVAADTFPTSGNYYLADYDCDNKNTVLTWDSTTYELFVTNNNKKAGVSCYLEFETNPKLSDMEVGSYVKYSGANGCTAEDCDGQNPNYSSDDSMGYCNNSTYYEFIVNGWRIAYIDDGSAYLISAGATDCMCTNSDGTTANATCSSYIGYDGDISLHLDNMNDVALRYCNSDYIYGGVCDQDVSWAMNATDFEKIMSSTLTSCEEVKGNAKCGYNNDLIDNGSYYWLAYTYSTSTNVFYFDPADRFINQSSSNSAYGVRPVLHLDSNVLVTGGTGTYEDPYTIDINTFFINGGATAVSDANKSSVNLSLLTVDATQMCISTNTSVCTNYVTFSTSYTLDWSNEEAGEKIVYVYYKNSSGRVVAALNKSITLLGS